MNAKEIKDWLTSHVAELLQVPSTSLNVREPFASYGLSSRDAVTISGDLEELLDRRLPVTLLYEYPTIELLSQFLENSKETRTPQRNPKPSPASSSEPIAIIGMACRFPGANSPESFWQLLCNGVDAISEVPSDRWNGRDYFHPDPSTPGKSISYWGGFLDRIDQFDPFFFGISPMEAKQMDPQQRLLLELSYEALEDAGQVKEEIQGTKTGVFIGISVNEYSLLQLADPLSITSHSGTGSALSIAANRISYFHDFHGPSVAIDTACSSSLASVHLACQSLRSGECNMALAGGINLILSPAHSIAFTKAGLLAPDGRCKSFDARANGYVRGEGGGLVVLKSLSSALADQDRIYAVINGSALNQDGRSNGLIAPSPEAQEALLREAYVNAGIDPENVQYVEAHGTGTLLGDEIEARSLGSVVGANRKNGRCKIGSVKTNIGHLEAAAGIAGFIKTVLSIKNRMVPPSLHYKTPNPHISFNELNLEVANELTPWPSTTERLVAGVSSFGFGGTNVHLVVGSVEINNEKNIADPPRSNHNILTLSATSSEALEKLAKSYYEFLNSNSEISVRDICYTASARRNHFGHRLVAIGGSIEQLKSELQLFRNGVISPSVLTGHSNSSSQPKLVFVFPGQGGQWIGMGRELLKYEPVFRNEIEQCDRLIQLHFKWSLIDFLVSDESSSSIDDIGFIQPALFSIQVSLAKLWQSWNITPDAVVGHSMGEVAAAHIAGVLTLEAALKVICLRSAVVRKSRGDGSMMVSELSRSKAEEILRSYGDRISIAAINGPASTVLSGDPRSIGSLMEELQRENLFCQLINVDIASHSPQMEQYRAELLGQLKFLEPKSAKVPIFSTVTGSQDVNLVFDANYWVDNLRKPVLFLDAIQQILNSGPAAFIEIGPHPVLLSSVQQTLLSRQQKAILLPSLRRDESEQLCLFRSLASLFVEGFNVDWKKFYSVGGNFSQLPSYPWQRQRFWVETNSNGRANSMHFKKGSPSHHLIGSRLSLADSEGKSVWQTEFDIRVLGFLSDHKVENDIIIPSAVFVEIGFNAAKEIGISESHEISQVVFHARMILDPEEHLRVQTVVQKKEGDVYSFGVYSYSKGDDTWTLHASANFITIRTNEPPRLPDVQIKDFMEECEATYSGKELYQKLSRRGIEYGRKFQGVEIIWVKKDGNAIGKVHLPEDSNYDLENFIIHPILLDACLQVIAATDFVAATNDLYLPVGCDSIRKFGDLNKTTYGYVSHSNTEPSGSDIQRFDVKLLNANGEIVCQLVDFRLQRIKKRTLSPITASDIKLYHTRWEKVAGPKGSNVNSNEKRNWVIFCDEEGYGKKLAEKIKENGDQCHEVQYSKFIKGLSQTNDGLFSQFIEKSLGESPSPVYGIIHLASLSIPCMSDGRVEDTDLIYSLGPNSILALVKTLINREEKLPRLWMVTKGSQSVNLSDKIAFEQSPVWGLGKVIGFELPELKCARIDLDPGQSPGEAAPLLFTQILSNDREDQIAFRENARYALRIFPYHLAATASPGGRTLQSNGTYLITGGLGGLGLTLANWMAQKSVQNLVLLGRSEPTEDQANIIEGLRKMGVVVTLFQADVSDRVQLRTVIEEVKKTLPPLKGVIHAAGLLDDGAIVNLNSERMRSVMAAKVEGTLNLHKETEDLPLDFFILFSSAVSVLGSPGQGNYAAASSFLDSFANYRYKAGLPTISINWGPWAEVGLAAEVAKRSDKDNHSNQRLVKVIQPDQGLEILEALLNESVPQVSVFPFDLANLLELYPPASEIPFFENALINRATYSSRSYTRPNLRQDYVAPRNNTELRLADLWQQTLHIDRVGVHDSFFELGGDSVLAAQILTSVQKSFGIRIDLKEAFKAFTVERLARLIEEELMAKIAGMTESEAEDELTKLKLN